ncbi:MAG: 4-alpha-glucanotransferase [Oscillospiraceae bacterium]|nr:4-alpha-glucanotransferase [Oscillospiraceae bacterium]
MRKSGILLHISSLPSRYGIGRMGRAAYDFVDFLHMSETAYWQILPLSPTSYGDSPYQSFSVYAGNPYFIDFATLEEQGLLQHEEYATKLWQRDPDSIDYELLYRTNIAVLRRAFRHFKEKPLRGYNTFKKNNAFWLPDYALFMALKAEHDGKSWDTWETPLAMRQPDAIEEAKTRLADEIELHCFIQFIFAQQWSALKQYASDNQVQIIGDMPIYVAYDSADVWCHPELFALDADRKPVEVAGCPPDPFSPTGQLWGNPLYDWAYHKKTGYKWWIQRLQYAAKLYDVIRIDHFRGFESYYTIPYGNEDAVKGQWRKGPNKQLFQAVQKELGDLHIIAEDLGFITPEVRKMLDALGYPGMKVLQFGFDSDPDNEHLPHTFRTPHCIAYTGTHDNMTLKGWLAASDKKTVKYAKNYLRCKKQQIPDEMVAACWQSIAEVAVAQMQDFLHSEKNGRMNTPSVLGGNWMFRTHSDQFTPELAKAIRKLNRTYGRAVQPPAPEVIKPEPKPDPDETNKPRRPYRRKRNEPPAQPTVTAQEAAPAEASAIAAEPAQAPETQPAEKPKRSNNRRKNAPKPNTSPRTEEPAEQSASAETPETPAVTETPAEETPKRRYTRRKKPAEPETAAEQSASAAETPAENAAPAEKPKRTYTRRKTAQSKTTENKPKRTYTRRKKNEPTEEV